MLYNLHHEQYRQQARSWKLVEGGQNFSQKCTQWMDDFNKLRYYLLVSLYTLQISVINSLSVELSLYHSCSMLVDCCRIVTKWKVCSKRGFFQIMSHCFIPTTLETSDTLRITWKINWVNVRALNSLTCRQLSRGRSLCHTGNPPVNIHTIMQQ